MPDSIILGSHKKFYVATTQNKGNGVFAGENIEEGSLIEICTSIVFNEEDAGFIDKTLLYNYYYALDFLGEQELIQFNIKDKSRAGALPLGAVPMANHSNDPNTVIEKEYNGNILYFKARALRDIKKDEEISISYGKVWFDVLE